METYRSFVPRLVARQFAANPCIPADAREEQIAGAVFLADISGFTAMTERLAHRGAAGVEELSHVLNSYFGDLIDAICGAGGDILKFAGDALLAVWRAEECGDPAAAVCRAARCGLEAQVRLGKFRTAVHNPLSLRIGIGSGLIRVLHVGGIAGRWELVATGNPLLQMSLAIDRAEPGQVALSPEAWILIADQASGDAPPQGTGCLEALRCPPDLPVEKEVTLTKEGLSALRSYLPENIVSFLDSGQADWLAELRRVTVIFVNFPGLNASTPLSRAQNVMALLQKTLLLYEGIVNKLSVDDKGATLLAAFGLPPLGHENDAERGVSAALDIKAHLGKLGVQASIGITTGQAFCGIVGNTLRREYTMIGDAVNLAARLMQSAPRDILCNEATREFAGRRIAFQALVPLILKGKSMPVPVFRPLEGRGGGQSSASGPRTPMVGRIREKQLVSRLAHGLSGGKGGVLTIEGEAGIGKSRLIGHLLDEARALDLTVLTGSGDAIEEMTPYHAWREAFTTLLDLPPGTEPRARQELVIDAIRQAAGEEHLAWLPLLNPALSTGFSETSASSVLSTQQRAEMANDLLVRLLVARPEPSKAKLLVFEDAHWIDSASWALILQVVRKVPSLLTVISTRPMNDKAPPEWGDLLQATGVHSIRLQPLPEQDAIELVCLRLGARSLPDSVCELIRAKTGGNPLFSEEIAYALRDSRQIVISGEDCRLAPDAGVLSEQDFPGTVDAIITSRIDRLTPLQQLAVKTASVIGRAFEFRNLHAVFPMKVDTERLTEQVRELERKDITSSDPAAPEPTLYFKHILFQEVAYNLMLFAQRRQLHRAIAEWLEKTHKSELPRICTLLAHHWSRAIDELRPEAGAVRTAVDCLHRAAEQALRSNANREAAVLLEEALRLLMLLPEDEDRMYRELPLQAMLGGPLIATRGFASPEVEKTYARALELCRRLGKEAERFPTMLGLWNHYLVRAQLHKAGELSHQLFELAQNLNCPELQLPAHRTLGETSFWLGDLTSARPHLEQVIALYDPSLHEQAVRRIGQDPGVVCGGFLAWVLWLQGYPDQAVETMMQTLALAERLGHLHSVAMALQNLTMVHQFRREAAPTLEYALRLTRLSEEQGFPLWSAGGTILRGWARCQEGKVQEGIQEMESGLQSWRVTGAELPVPYYLSLLAEGYAKADKRGKGLGLIAEAIESSNRSGEAWWRSELYRLKGEMTLAVPEGSPAAAKSCFLEAVRIARQQGARSLELRAAFSLARLHSAHGSNPEAYTSLHRIRSWFNEGEDTADLKEAALFLKAVR